jgi:uncharacterized GH25 family protein
MRMSNLASALGAVIALTPAAAFAHDVWLVPQKRDGATVVQVKFGDPSHVELADFHKIVVLEVIGPTGRTSLKRPLMQTLPGREPALETRAFTPPAGAILAVTLDNGFYAVDPADGVESNTSKLLISSPKESWWVPKFGKTLLGAGSWQVRSNALLEITPLADPFAGGQTLTVKVEHRGKPVSGAKVTYGDGKEPIAEDKRPVVTTDRDGTAKIDIARKGPYLLTVDLLTDPTRPELADKDELYATLAFDLTK